MQHGWNVVNVRSVFIYFLYFLFFIFFHTSAQANLVGTIEGQAGVNASGAATYSIPINILPGTAGHQPDLSIEFSTHFPNGLMGIGFSLSGFSLIQRCGTGIVQDGAFSGIDFDNEDQFCLDG